MKSPDRLGRRLADAREANQAEGTDVVENPADLLEKIAHAVGTREDEPIVAAELEENIGERVVGNLLGDGDKRQLDHLGAEGGEFEGQFRRLIAGTRHRDAATGERENTAHKIRPKCLSTRAAVAAGALKSSVESGRLRTPMFSWKK